MSLAERKSHRFCTTCCPVKNLRIFFIFEWEGAALGCPFFPKRLFRVSALMALPVNPIKSIGNKYKIIDRRISYSYNKITDSTK